MNAWLNEKVTLPDDIVFPSARGKPLSRDGVYYLIKQMVQRALPDCPSLAAKNITPHVIRLSTVLQLLRAGVDVATSALWSNGFRWRAFFYISLTTSLMHVFMVYRLQGLDQANG